MLSQNRAKAKAIPWEKTLNLAALLVRLPEGSIAMQHLIDPDATVYGVRFLTPAEQGGLRSDVLYFCEPEQLSTALDEAPFLNCVLINAIFVPEGAGESDSANIVVLDAGANPYACFNALQAFFVEERDVSSIVRRLLAAHFSNKGLRYLIEEAYVALRNPIAVVDTNYRYIAHNLGELKDDESTFAQVMREEMLYESILEPGVEYISRMGLDTEIARQHKPVARYNDHLGCNTLTGAVMVRGICVAHVMMADTDHPFGSLDEEVFGRLVLFVGQELQKMALYETSWDQSHSFFLVDLLNDEQPVRSVIERRIKVLNFRPFPRLYVLVIHPRENELLASDIEHIMSQLSVLRRRGLYAKYRDDLVVLHSRQEDDPLDEDLLGKLREVAALNHLDVGISNSFDYVADIRAYYAQACRAVTYGNLVKHALDDQSVYLYRNYAYIQMMEQTSRNVSLLNSCHPALLDLLHYDEAHGSELMDTLFAYLQCANSAARASAMMHLHKNTLLYRLGRIRQVTGMDLTSGEDIFVLQLSFRVLLYLGMWAPKMTVTRAELHDA